MNFFLTKGSLAACFLTTLLAGGCRKEPSKNPAQSFTAAEGLEVTLWASEPDVINPTNIDIDERGRIWVLEAVNYRVGWGGVDRPDFRPTGDRITILEDTDGDGAADRTKVFDQNRGLRSPLGIAVLGNNVIISQSPNLIVYTKDEQDNILNKEVLLTGWQGIDHDHGLHAVVFGHDGRYYFNSGDRGFDVKDKSGKRWVSSNQGPYYAGTVLRVNPDGSDFVVFAHNFRNPYEVALDSFGNVWQTDNDDDGNVWVRLNLVLEGGNFGFWGPGGRPWRSDKGTHFHSEDPGVIPNVARLGAGAPTGLLLYEGELLPKRYRSHLIHAEAGARFINSYFLTPDNAGFSSKTERTVSSTDTWFRPTDVAVSHEGAVYFSDWYDAAVGGHQMADTKKGRIYRLAPRGYEPSEAKLDLQTSPGLAKSLRSPNQSTRYLAYSAIKERGADALFTLTEMWKQEDPVLKARALWLIGGIQGAGERLAHGVLRDEEANLRILALRVLRAQGAEITGVIEPLLRDPSPRVRRAVAVALQDTPPEQSLPALVELCKGYDGHDRWYLEALGLGARGKENQLYARLRKIYPDKWNSLLGQFIWEFRPSRSLPYLLSSLNEPGLTLQQRSEVLRCLSVMPSLEAGKAVAKLMVSRSTSSRLVREAFSSLSRQLFSQWINLREHPEAFLAVEVAFDSPELRALALEVAGDWGHPRFGSRILALAKAGDESHELRQRAIRALGRTRHEYHIPELEKLSFQGPLPVRLAAIRALGEIGGRGLHDRLKAVVLSREPNEVRVEAVGILARTDPGCNLLLDLEVSGELPSELRSVASRLTLARRSPEIRARAQELLPPPLSKNRSPLPTVEELLERSGDPDQGRIVFQNPSGPKCASCHSLGKDRQSTGPDLAFISDKLGKEALLDSILNPSAGIAPEYYVWILETKSAGEVIGILTGDTSQEVELVTGDGDRLRLQTSDILSRRRSYLSLMPEGIVNTMTAEQLVDLLAFLEGLSSMS